MMTTHNTTDSNEQQGAALDEQCPWCQKRPQRYLAPANNPHDPCGGLMKRVRCITYQCPLNCFEMSPEDWNTRSHASVAAGFPPSARGCTCPSETHTVGIWTARYRLDDCPVHGTAAASSPLPAEELPFDDYCAGAGDCRACKGINCTCPHHAPNLNPESLYATCRRVWVCKRCGNCLDHCRHKDESNFHEDLAMPCSVKTPAEPEGEHEQADYDYKAGWKNLLRQRNEWLSWARAMLKRGNPTWEYLPEGDAQRKRLSAMLAATPPDTPSDAAMLAQQLVNQWQSAWISTQDISRDSEADLVRRIVAAIITRYLGATNELVDEVQLRMDHVVETAVEWHQVGREGGEWFEAAEKLGAAINSLLELRDKPAPAPECFCGTELEAGLCPNGHDPVATTSPSETAVGGKPRRCVKCRHYETVDLHDEGECQVQGQSGFICGCKCEFAPTCLKCGHDVGIERTLKRCKARIDGGEALCQCHCEFAAPVHAAGDDEGESKGCCQHGHYHINMYGHPAKRLCRCPLNTDNRWICATALHAAALRSGDGS